MTSTTCGPTRAFHLSLRPRSRMELFSIRGKGLPATHLGSMALGTLFKRRTHGQSSPVTGHQTTKISLNSSLVNWSCQVSVVTRHPGLLFQQQGREVLLLTKVPKSALATILICSLLYPKVGLFLLVKTYKTSKECDHTASSFPYWDLASAAWNENEHN
jgi:hypothetical protein